MRWLFHPLLLLLANSSESNLAKQVEYLKAENVMLRKRLRKWLRTTPEECALLVRLGEAVGPGVSRLLRIVQYNWYPPPRCPTSHPSRQIGPDTVLLTTPAPTTDNGVQIRLHASHRPRRLQRAISSLQSLKS